MKRAPLYLGAVLVGLVVLAAQIGRLVASHASTQTQNNVFASKLIHGANLADRSRPRRGRLPGGHL